MNMPTNTPTGGAAYLQGRPTEMGPRRQKDKPGLAEMLALLQQFGPTAQVNQQMDQTKLDQARASAEYAQAHGFPNLDAMQMGQQQEHQQKIEQHQTDQESRLDEAAAGQTKLHDNANFIDATKLVTDPMISQHPELLDAIRQRFSIPSPDQVKPDPRLSKHIIPR